MRISLLASVYLVALPCALRAADEEPRIWSLLRAPVGQEATLVRRGSGTVLYLTRHAVRVSADHVGILDEGGEQSVSIAGDLILARRAGTETWTPIRQPGGLVFPELRLPASLAEQYDVASETAEARGGLRARLIPRSASLRAQVTHLDITVTAEGLPGRVIFLLADGSREERIYGRWRPTSTPPAEMPAASVDASPIVWPPETNWGSSIERSLAAIQKKVGDLRDMAGRFERTKSSLLLRKPAVATGTFRYVPGRLLWSDEEPRVSHVLILRDRMDVLDPEARRLERFPIRDPRLQRYVFLGFDSSLAEGLRHLVPLRFDEDETTVRIDLAPSGGRLATHIRRLTLVLDRKEGVLRELAYTDRSGDSVRTRLLGVRRNAGLRTSDVTLPLPEGTRIVESPGGGPWR